MTSSFTKKDRRTQLLHVALDLFAEKGYHSTSIADIIVAAGVARGTFYNYFDSKRQIFGELLDLLFDEVIASVFPVDLASKEPVQDQVKRLIRSICSRMRDRLPMARVLLEQAVGLDEDANAQLQKFYGRMLEHTQHSLEAGQKMGIIRDGDAGVLAICLLGMIKESLYQQLLGTSKPELDDVVQEVFDVASRGILSFPL